MVLLLWGADAIPGDCMELKDKEMLHCFREVKRQ